MCDFAHFSYFLNAITTDTTGKNIVFLALVNFAIFDYLAFCNMLFQTSGKDTFKIHLFLQLICIGYQWPIVSSLKFSCLLLKLWMVWLHTIFAICSSPLLHLVHCGPPILVFSPSLGIASLPWGGDHSVLLPLNYGTLYPDHSVLPIACLNSNRCLKLTCFQNVIFLS